MRWLPAWKSLTLAAFILSWPSPGANASPLDLRPAVIVCPASLTPPERKAIQLLKEEVHKRAQFWWPESPALPAAGEGIVIGPVAGLEQFAGSYATELRSSMAAIGAEGYRICVRAEHGRSLVFVIGKDSRGILFGIGRLLRELHLARSSAL